MQSSAGTARQINVERLMLMVGALLLIPVIISLVIEKDNLLVMYLAALFVCLLISFPKLCFYLFLISVSVYYPYIIGRVGLHPSDMCMFLLAGSLIIGFLLGNKHRIGTTRIDKFFWFLISATIISAIFAYNFGYSVIACLRIIVVFVAFRVVYRFALEEGVGKLMRFYVYHVFALSLLNLILFVQSGGQERIFGTAWLAFETYSMTALPMSLAFLLWSGRTRERFKFGVIALVIGLALLATQSRAPLLAVFIAVPILLLAANWKTTRGKIRLRWGMLPKAVIPIVVVVALVFVFKETLFESALGRITFLFESLRSPQETVQLRIVLWTAAIKAFLTNPITGIGIGNFRLVSEIVTDVRFLPEWYVVEGMSAHNVILHYLAETGLIGTAAIIALAWINLKIAFQSFRKSVSEIDLQLSAVALIAIIVFCVTILYMRAWTWGQGGYIMAILFGLNVARNHVLAHPRPESEPA